MFIIYINYIKYVIILIKTPYTLHLLWKLLKRTLMKFFFVSSSLMGMSLNFIYGSFFSGVLYARTSLYTFFFFSLLFFDSIWKYIGFPVDWEYSNILSCIFSIYTFLNLSIGICYLLVLHVVFDTTFDYITILSNVNLNYKRDFSIMTFSIVCCIPWNHLGKCKKFFNLI